ncbi:MAG: hypothetical protein KGJ11_00020 [Candidatus Omnitrophica bacterium]|nr:hypothetical protein [Candidatus Omnitrophota bacterium]
MKLLIMMKTNKLGKEQDMDKKVNYRQGDILLIGIDEDSNVREESISNVLAEGEVTGHKHEIVNGTVHSHSWRSDIYVRSTGATTLVHPEHGHIKIKEGLYRFEKQREYDELNNRYVAD